ncbi:MAG: SGNH/GDSL hydrolase family protein [Patescibacteria group bacterium]
MTTVCIFGDSIVWGAFDPEGGGWATRLRNAYEAQGLPVDKDTDVYNLGVSGDNTEDLLERFDVEAAAREPSTIMFAIGINDSHLVISKDENRVPILQFEKNINTLLNKAKEITSKIAFIGLTPVDESKTTPVPWNTDKNCTKENRDKYDAMIKNFCKENNIPYLSMEEVITFEELSDGLHPNVTGHQKMFEAVKGFIKQKDLL